MDGWMDGWMMDVWEMASGQDVQGDPDVEAARQQRRDAGRGGQPLGRQGRRPARRRQGRQGLRRHLRQAGQSLNFT